MIATACDFNPEKATIELHNVDFSLKDEELLAILVEGIIPKTDTPGAKDLNLQLFVMKMVDDCESPEQQKLFLAGLKNAHQSTLDSADAALAYLEGLPNEDVFLTILKARTVQGYLNSEYVMTEQIKYELVPGRYNGAVKING